jgi:class 3 adenylate cyclase
MERKLAAIFSADVKGYSLLMAHDEAATITTLTTYRHIMTTLIEQHHGRVVDAPGDNLLAAFPSAVDAVQSAVAIQRALRSRNAALPNHRQMHYRIGLNVGDVITAEDGRIYGDGVNIAARIESLAEGGGISISGTIYDQIATKLAFAYEDLGEQTVKNIPTPVRVYRMTFDSVQRPAGENTGDDSFSLPPSQMRPVETQRDTRWFPQRPYLPQGKALATLATVALLLPIAYWTKTGMVPDADGVQSRGESSAVQARPLQPQSQRTTSPPSTERHRSFETALAPGQQVIPIRAKDGQQIGAYTESHALVVGIVNSTGGWPPLPGVKSDVQAVTAALEKQGFHIVVVMDPTLAELESAYSDFTRAYGMALNNRLLFYFAGNGYTVKPAYALGNEKDGMGYLVVRDTPLPTTNLDQFRRQALSMERFASLAREIQAKHVLFVFDSCFSGAITFALARSSPVPPESDISPRTGEAVRQFIAAGTAEQQVPDQSIFRRLFVEALGPNSEADHNGDGYVTGSELGQFLQTQVGYASQQKQTPQYGKMSDPRLNRGEFVFTLPVGDAPPTVAALPAQE